MTFELPIYTFNEMEANSDQSVDILLDSLTEVDVSVEVDIITLTNGGSATEATLNQDYTFNNGLVVTFTETINRRSLSLSILADDQVEMQEAFTLDFSRATGSAPITNGDNPTTTVFIDDTDGNIINNRKNNYL